MKAISIHRIAVRVLALGLFASTVSCVTTYDRAGRPVQMVDPGAAVAGAAAAGIIGYALANDGHHHYRGHHHHDHRPHRRGRGCW